MTPFPRLAPVLVLAILALSGCSDGGGDAPGSSAGGDPFRRADPAAGQAVLRFGSLKAPVATTLWANGTVAVQDTCNTGACVVDTSRAFHVTDITQDVPEGVPVEIAVELSYAPHPFFGGPEVFLAAPESVVYYDRTAMDYATGTGTIQAMIRPAGTVEVVVAANAPGGETPETPYTLSIAIVAGPDRVPPGAPVGVLLGPGSNLTFRAPGQTAPGFLLYGPDDALIGPIAGNVTLPAGAARGEYVVLLPNGAQWGNLSSDTATTMRALALAAEPGPVGTMPATGPYQASWDVGGSPFAVGFQVYPAEAPALVAPLASTGFELTMTGENGVAIESGFLCGFCLTFGGLAWTFSSGTGDPDVVAQTYDLAGSTTMSHELRVVPFALYLDRE